MKSIEEIKEKLSEEIYDDVKEVLKSYAYKNYNYLTISIKDWERLVLNIINVIIKDKQNIKVIIGELSRRLNIAVRNFISIKISEGNVVILDNLLIKLSNEFKGQHQFILLRFLRELKALEIEFDSNIYYLLKRDSTRFKKLLEYLDISDYSYTDFFKYLKYELDIDSFNEKRINNKNKNQNLDLRIVPVEARNLYDEFENSLYITLIEKKLIINYLLSTLDDNKQRIVISYCKGLLYEKDEEMAVNIIKELNILYKNFLERGEYLGESPALSEIYKLILMRKSSIILVDSNGIANDKNLMLELVYMRLTLKHRLNLGKKLKSLELYYLDNGYTLEEFNAKLEKAINTVAAEIDCSEEEYMSKFLDILYEDLNTGIFRK